jgi:hypothetical protein
VINVGLGGIGSELLLSNIGTTKSGITPTRHVMCSSDMILQRNLTFDGMSSIWCVFFYSILHFVGLDNNWISFMKF